jgi:hypothetical protein
MQETDERSLPGRRAEADIMELKNLRHLLNKRSVLPGGRACAVGSTGNCSLPRSATCLSRAARSRASSSLACTSAACSMQQQLGCSARSTRRDSPFVIDNNAGGGFGGCTRILPRRRQRAALARAAAAALSAPPPAAQALQHSPDPRC